jgi:hypothetical protein
MTNQGDFQSGDILTAADLNGFSQVTIAYEDAVSVPNTTNTVPNLTNELIDVGGWHSNVTNPDRITVDLDGVYLINLSIYGLDLGGTSRGLGVIYKSGAPIASFDVDGGPRDFTASVFDVASSGQYYTCQIYQSSGSTKDCDVRLSVMLVRAT